MNMVGAKISSVIYNMSGDISQSILVAGRSDGSDTSINVSFITPVIINTWNSGTLVKILWSKKLRLKCWRN
jgi:hypothetical protein